MIEWTLDVPTAQGVMPVELFSPNTDKPLPAVILFMDAPGIREELRDAARRIARGGLVCALPDLYYRLGHIRIDLTRRTDAHAALYRVLADSLDNRQVAGDTACLLSRLSGLDCLREGPVGCVGFSVGGRFALQAAGLFPGQVSAVATVCGTGLVSEADDAPHKTLGSAVRASFVLDFAADDPAMPADAIDSLCTAFEQAGIAPDVTIHPGTRHGYNFAMRPMYDAAASQASWQRIERLFNENL
jgi:carboxymethylenebutenolidase